MAKMNTDSYKALEHLVAESGDTYGFDGAAALKCFAALFGIVKDMGINPEKTDELLQGVISLFNIERINMPDLAHNRFILTPNHVTDFDAIVFGLFHPKIRIVAKDDWTNNETLQPFLKLHYDLYGFDRASIQSLRGLLKDAVHYFNDDTENKHFLVFSQGTISDFNHNSPERISSIAQKIALKTGVPIVNVFTEQVSLYHPTRIIFDEPMQLTAKDDFPRIWLERQTALQNTLNPPARRPILSEKHANNNKPGDLFF